MILVDLFFKTKYDTNKSELENKIPDTRGLIKKQTAILKLLKSKIKYEVLVV